MLNLGREQEIELPDGRTFTLGRLELKVIRAFAAWVKGKVGDPFATVDRYVGKIADSLLMPLVKEAEDTAKQLKGFSLGCPLAQQWIATEEGGAKLFQLLLLARHPQATEEDGLAVSLELIRRDAAGTALSAAQGEVPNAAGPAA